MQPTKVPIWSETNTMCLVWQVTQVPSPIWFQDQQLWSLFIHLSYYWSPTIRLCICWWHTCYGISTMIDTRYPRQITCYVCTKAPRPIQIFYGPWGNPMAQFFLLNKSMSLTCCLCQNDWLQRCGYTHANHYQTKQAWPIYLHWYEHVQISCASLTIYHSHLPRTII